MSNLPEPFKTYEKLTHAAVSTWFAWWSSYFSFGLKISQEAGKNRPVSIAINTKWYDPETGILRKWNGYRWIEKIRIVR